VTHIVWKSEPDEHDYPAAASYLSLVAAPDIVEATVKALQAAEVTHFKAKDIMRSSRLDLLPVLLVRGSLDRGFPLEIADGYHRVCASYHLDENLDVPCRIVDLATI